MNYQTHNEVRISTGGTHYVGTIQSSVSELIEHFGQPMRDTGASLVEWQIEYSNGTVATIYIPDYEDGEGRRTPAEFQDVFHIGGHNLMAWIYISATLVDTRRDHAA